MLHDLPDEFDLIVLGTGFTESCIAAAASRVGKSVLHLDANEHYGGAFASFNFESLNDVLTNGKNYDIQNGKYQFHAPATIEAEEGAPKSWTKDELLAKSKYFNIDLCPKLMYSDGDLVKLLIKSNICRYLSFRRVDRVCTRFGGKVINVPCSRTHAFQTKDLSLVEKRLLMKFIMSCKAYDASQERNDSSEFAGRTFAEFLRAQSVTEKIATCVVQAIAMCNEQTSFEEGMARTKKFLDSVGHYGNTPFLYPMYGCGEIPQSFCRLCAVFGGIYCLGRAVESLQYEESSRELVLGLEGKQIRAKHLVTSPSSLAMCNLAGSPQPNISRAIFLATRPLPNDDDDQQCVGGGVSLLRLMNGIQEATLLQLSHYSETCPDGIYIYHLTTPALSENPESDIHPFLTQVFEDGLEGAGIVYSAYFTLTTSSHALKDFDWPVHCTPGPYNELDYDLSIESAQRIFHKIFPTEEFLPRAPDPEEIVMDGEDPRAINEQSLPEDVRAHIHELEQQAADMHFEDRKEDAMEME